MLYFSNPGEIDIRGAFIAGLSVKTSDAPIGYFGTGLKYAIASILRWGGEITIYSGLTEHKFITESLNFRGNDFHQIFCDGVPVSLTTDYGKNWEPWQVFRELYANALDEGGHITTNYTSPAATTTLIKVDCEKLEEIYPIKDSIILPLTNWEHMSAVACVNNLPSSYIYYRNVRISANATALTYNLLQEMELTEDRTIKYHFDLIGNISSVIQKLPAEEMVLKALTSEGFEKSIKPFFEYDCSPAFIAVAIRLYKEDPLKHDRLKQVVKKYKPELLEPIPITLSPVRQTMLDKAIIHCERLGYPSIFPITVAELGTSCLGKYEKASGKIYLSPTVFEQGTKQVVSCLYEELFHAHTGGEDLTYSTQTTLFNKIISLYEEHVIKEAI